MFLEITGRFCHFQKPENLLQVTKAITGPKPKCKFGLGLSSIFWETSVPWEGREGRSKHAGWSAKEERWGRGPSRLVHPREPQKQNKGSQRPGTPVRTVGLHAYHLGLVSEGLEHLWPFWSPLLLLKDLRCPHQSSPVWPFTLDLWYSGLIIFSAVGECNMCAINHFLCGLSWRKKCKFR